MLDSETQNGDATDPIWHNHYVELAPIPQCEGFSTNGTGVVEITFEQPGDVEINDETAKLTEMPISFNGTNALTNASMTSSPGNNVDNAVSFNLIPVFEGKPTGRLRKRHKCIHSGTDLASFLPPLPLSPRWRLQRKHAKTLFFIF